MSAYKWAGVPPGTYSTWERKVFHTANEKKILKKYAPPVLGNKFSPELSLDYKAKKKWKMEWEAMMKSKFWTWTLNKVLSLSENLSNTQSNKEGRKILPALSFYAIMADRLMEKRRD